MKSKLVIVAIIAAVFGVGVGKFLARFDLLPDIGGPPAIERFAKFTAARVTEVHAFSPDADVAFLGDSITDRGRWGEAFPGLVIANRGVFGQAFPHMLDRIDGVLAVNPDKVFVMGGINGADFQTPQEAANTFGAILDGLVGTQVVAQSTLECRCAELNYIRALNPLLKSEAARRNVTWLNLNATMSTQDGLRAELTHDGIHLNGLGYRTWRDALLPLMP